MKIKHISQLTPQQKQIIENTDPLVRLRDAEIYSLPNDSGKNKITGIIREESTNQEKYSAEQQRGLLYS